MKKKSLVDILAAVALVLPGAGCAIRAQSEGNGAIEVQVRPTAFDGKYDYATDMIPYGGQDYQRVKDSVFCLRQVVTYKATINIQGETEEVTLPLTGHGTGFVYQYEYGHSYLVTNDHIAATPKTIIDLRGNVWTRIESKLFIVDNALDENATDDMPLEVVVTSKHIDIAVVKADKKLPVYPYAIGNSDELEAGNVVRMEGFPLGATKATTEGIVSNPNNNFNPSPNDINLEHNFIVDAPTNPGNSGSPVFALRDGKYEWVGQIHAGFKAEGFKFVVSINDFKPLLKEVDEKERPKRWYEKIGQREQKAEDGKPLLRPL